MKIKIRTCLKVNRYRLLRCARPHYEAASVIVCAVLLDISVVSEVEVVGAVVFKIVIGVYNDADDGTGVDGLRY